MISMAAILPASHLGQQSLADDPTYCIGKAGAYLLLFIPLEHADYSVDRLSGIYCMQRREDQVACFSSGESYLKGFPVSHFSDKYYFGGLAESALNPFAKVSKSVPSSLWLKVAFWC